MTFVNLLKVKIVTALMLISILAVNFSFHNDTLYIDLVHECVKLLKPKNCAILIAWNIISLGFKVYLLCSLGAKHQWGRDIEITVSVRHDFHSNFGNPWP